MEVVATNAPPPPTDKPDDGQLTMDEFQRRKVNTIAEAVFRNVDVRYKVVTKNVVRLPKGLNKKRMAKLVKEKGKTVQYKIPKTATKPPKLGSIPNASGSKSLVAPPQSPELWVHLPQL